MLKQNKQMPDPRPCLPSPSCPARRGHPGRTVCQAQCVWCRPCMWPHGAPGVPSYIWPGLPPALCSPRSFQNSPVHASQTLLLSGVNQPAKPMGPHPRVQDGADGATPDNQKHSADLSHPLLSISLPHVPQTAPQSPLPPRGTEPFSVSVHLSITNALS